MNTENWMRFISMENILWNVRWKERILAMETGL